MRCRLSRRISGAALLCALLALLIAPAGVTFAKDKKKDDKAAAAAPAGEEKPFSDVVKDMEEVKGLFTFYRKAEDAKLLMEILPSQLDGVYLFAATTDQSLGERGFYASMMAGDFAFRFRKVGKQIQWIEPNARFMAEEGSPAGRAVARSFPYAIRGSAKILSKPHEERKSILIDVSELLLSRDFLGLGPALGRAYDPTAFTIDTDRSAILDLKNFPESSLLSVLLHYTTENPKAFSATMPDSRSAPFRVQYQFAALPQGDYTPRAADDRVGHFHTVALDFSTDRAQDPHVRYVARWNLEKKDPKAPRSEPKEPIVFWLENTIPVEYRDPIREGALLWNKAFEKIGFTNAVVVKQQPDDATWDPADTRYSTIRWFTGTDNFFAIGPSRINPWTGQIFDADIGWGDNFIRFQRRFGDEFASPFLDEDVPAPVTTSLGRRAACTYAAGLSQQAAFGLDLLDARELLTPELSDKMIREVLVQVTAHEVGHTLGFKHNFRGSDFLTPEEMNDVATVDARGQTASVMDYNPTIIASKGETQGHFLSPTRGPSVYWAVAFAYNPIDGDEKAELARIAARGGDDPGLPFSADEDAGGAWATTSVDPFATRYDASSDPLGYGRRRMALVKELWTTMDPKLLEDGEGYQILRRAVQRSLGEYARVALNTTKWVGGIFTHRAHVGDPGGKLPFMPVPPEKQREALALLTTNVFGENAFDIPPSLLNKLAIDRLETIDWPSFYNQARFDYPWHDAALALQRVVLDRMLHAVTLQRLLDNELRFGAGTKPFRMAEVFGGLETAIWSDVAPGRSQISSVRRNLQREHVRQLLRLALREGGPSVPATSGVPFSTPQVIATPWDATTLSRASLVQVRGRARAALASKVPLESTTRAHLQEIVGQISAALDAQVVRDVTD
jgi:hypothetical protein